MSRKFVFGLILFSLVFLLMVQHTFAHDLPSEDLSDYIRPYDTEVVGLAESIGMKPFLSYPLENARAAYYWVSENIRYMYDRQRWGTDDYWQLPSTTINLGTGDCEDQAILLASLLRALRLPRENVRVAVSYTQHHAWVEIKLPLPIYGLEATAIRALELLENKKVAVSIGEYSYNQSITSSAIADLKAKGLSHRDGWIPLDTTAKIFEMPVPFSLWLTYGYNIYDLFGRSMSPEYTFQDRARIWSMDRIVESGEVISFDIPCIDGDKILGVVKAKNAWKEQVLEHIQGMDIRVDARGPFYVKSAEKIKVEWKSAEPISIYILPETAFWSWRAFGIVVVPPSPNYYCGTGTDQSIEYNVKNDDKYYVVLWYVNIALTLAPTRIYDLKVTRKWQETSCNIQVSINNPQGASMTTTSITQREVERRFDFTAEKSGVYKVVLKNFGESAPIYVRLEEYSTPLSPEIAGVSESLALAEQEYVDKVAKSLGKKDGDNGLGFVWKSPFNIVIFSTTFIIIIVATVLVLRKRSRFVTKYQKLQLKTKLMEDEEPNCFAHREGT